MACCRASFCGAIGRGVPWVSVLVCGLAWALALKLPFERLISIDLILYGSSLILEFVALIALRMREPELPRPFRAGSFPFACLLARGPTVLIAYALYASRAETLGDPGTPFATVSSLAFAAAVALLGPPLYRSRLLSRDVGYRIVQLCVRVCSSLGRRD